MIRALFSERNLLISVRLPKKKKKGKSAQFSQAVKLVFLLSCVRCLAFTLTFVFLSFSLEAPLCFILLFHTLILLPKKKKWTSLLSYELSDWYFLGLVSLNKRIVRTQRNPCGASNLKLFLIFYFISCPLYYWLLSSAPFSLRNIT